MARITRVERVWLVLQTSAMTALAQSAKLGGPCQLCSDRLRVAGAALS